MPSAPTLRIAAYLVLRRDGEILLLKRFNTGYEDGKYSLIAGHVEHFESPSQAIVREAREEVGIEVAIEDLRFVKVVHRQCPDNLVFVDYFFEASRWNGEPGISEPEKCSDLIWVPANSIPADAIPYVKSVLTSCRQHPEALLEYGW